MSTTETNHILRSIAEALLYSAGYAAYLLHTSDVRKEALILKPDEALTEDECQQIIATAYSLQNTVEDQSLRSCLSHAVELFFEERDSERDARSGDMVAEARKAIKSLIQDIELKFAELEGAVGIASAGGEA